MSNGKAKEEEDLDDLDDVLDQFTTPSPAPAKDDFAKQFASEMEAMVRQLGVAESSAPSGSADTPNVEANDSFQDKIRQAMEKIHESEQTLKADSGDDPESLESLLATLGDLGLDGDGAEGTQGLESMLETMMTQLMSKEILYEPLKELDTKYPEYLSASSSTLSPADLSRYTEQKTRVSQIVALFEDPSYSDENPSQSAEILRLMNEVQTYGSPPSEIMGSMPPGLELGADGLPNIPEGCVVA